MTSFFDAVELAPRDPILGLNEQYNADTRPHKVNLGVGVYYDDEGQVPLLRAVRQAETSLVQAAHARSYLPINGLPSYNKAAQTLLLGEGAEVIESGRALTVQTLGGTGALKIGADFLHRLYPKSKVVISNPSWENHRALFERAGFAVDTYPYYDPQTHGLNFEGMLEALKTLAPRTIVVLHACCHNPTGADPSFEQWQQVAQIIKERGLIPFLDIAYQGFGTGLEEDASTIHLFVSMGLTMLISSSFSKSFSLYGERVGALTLITSSADESTRILSQLKRVIRTNYSNPPTHGGAVVAAVLNTPELHGLWVEELAQMRRRIQSVRTQLVEKLKARKVSQDFSFVLTQRGMFSYSGLTPEQVEQLQAEHAVYAVSSGRICVAALNSGNIDYVADAIAQVL